MKCTVNKEYVFSHRYKELLSTLDRAKMVTHDPLKAFVAKPRIEQLERMIKKAKVLTFKQNVDKLFKACVYLGVPRVYVGKRELVGADCIRFDGWPAMWRLAELIDGPKKQGRRISAGAGNADQYQIDSFKSLLPESIIGKAFDVNTRNEIDTKDFRKAMVVTRK